MIATSSAIAIWQKGMKEVFLVIKIKIKLSYYKVSFRRLLLIKFCFEVVQEKKDCAIFGTIVSIKKYEGTLSD